MLNIKEFGKKLLMILKARKEQPDNAKKKEINLYQRVAMKLTNQTKLIYFMRSGHIYHVSELDKSGIKTIRDTIANARRKGFLIRSGFGRYKLSASGLDVARTYIEPCGHTVIEAHLYDTPPIAWPV